VKRIFVALDGSDRAPTVLAAALRLAELADATLVVYRAIGVPPDMPRELLETTDVRLEDVLTRNARESLARLTADVPTRRIEHVVTSFATPWDGICRTAREHDADLIVLGSHGYGGLDRLLGTNAAKVVNHADRNVLVVKTLL
jgi:universal stress protein F